MSCYLLCLQVIVSITFLFSSISFQTFHSAYVYACAHKLLWKQSLKCSSLHCNSAVPRSSTTRLCYEIPIPSFHTFICQLLQVGSNIDCQSIIQQSNIVYAAVQVCAHHQARLLSDGLKMSKKQLLKREHTNNILHSRNNQVFSEGIQQNHVRQIFRCE